MSKSSERHLRLVPFSGNDYTLGKAFGPEHGKEIAESEHIGSVFSLYFQWEKHRSACVHFSSSLVVLEMDYDRDERFPTEIRLSLSDPTQKALFREQEKIVVRFEIFRNCYQFESAVLAVHDDVIIVSVPSTIKHYKARLLPRYKIQSDAFIEWQSLEQGEIKKFKIKEVSLDSICVEANSMPERGQILLGEHKIIGELVRNKRDSSIIKIKFETHIQYGAYFDFYRALVYPYLRSRYDFSPEAGLDLYVKTKYFEKFSKTELETTLSELPKTWEAIKSGTHETIADYYVVDEQGNPTAAGSLALAFFDEKNPVWMFHQNCSLKNPDLLERTGSIYTWRTEYLSGRPEELTAGVTYDSKSRWIERLYTKFFRYSSQKAVLKSLRSTRLHFQRNASTKQRTSVPLRTYNVGQLKRTSTVSNNFWAGAEPKFLNAGEGLNEILLISDTVTEEQIRDIAEALLEESGLESIYLRLMHSVDASFPNFNGIPLITDRLCIIPKDELFGLMSSIEHAFAITQRKLADG